MGKAIAFRDAVRSVISERQAVKHTGKKGGQKLFSLFNPFPEIHYQARWQRREQIDEYLGAVNLPRATQPPFHFSMGSGL